LIISDPILDDQAEMFYLILFSCACSALWGEVFHHRLSMVKYFTSSYEWERITDDPFDELLLTWNGQVPTRGKLTFDVSIKIDSWSPWFRYGSFGMEKQEIGTAKEGTIRSSGNGIKILGLKKGTKFRVKVVAHDGASLSDLRYLHLCATEREEIKAEGPTFDATSIMLPVCGRAQHSSTSLATSLSALAGYLEEKEINFEPSTPLLAAASLSSLLGGDWACWIERPYDFNRSLYFLSEGVPSLIAVRGELGSKKYETDHFLVVKGYDDKRKEVICIDPSFPSDEETNVRYDLEKLMEAWEKSGCLSLFCERASRRTTPL
jgi:hypothetical protein